MTFSLNNILSFFAILLFIIALWNEISSGRYIKFFEKLQKTHKDPFLFIQGVLDFICNKFIIRQILNPYFLFPFSALAVVFLKNNFNSFSNSDIILLVTFVALLWYSKETFELRKAQVVANKQTGRQVDKGAK